MGAVATGIPSRHMMQVWPQLWPLIKPAWELDPEHPDLLAGIRKRDFQLWAVYKDGKVIAGIATKLLREATSGNLLAHLWLVGGSRVPEWLPDFMAKFSAWARAEGCVRITAAGRKGWDRLVRSYGGRRLEDFRGTARWELDLEPAHVR